MKYVYSFVFTLLSAMVSAQPIKGILKDPQGNAIENANIIIPKYNLHTHSDDRGRFEIDNIQNGDTILISHMSYESVSMVINNDNLESILSILMIDKSINLDQVTISPQSQTLKTLAKIDI